MPTVTVLAWCLIASTGRVSSSIPAVSAAVRSSTTRLGVPTAPCSIWYTSSGSSPGGVAEQRRDAHRGAGFEVAVVAADAQAVEERGGGTLDRGREAHQQVVARRRVQGCGRHDRRHRRPHLTQRTRGGVDGERGLVPEEVAGHGREHEGHVGVDRGHADGLERGSKRRSPSVAITIGAARCAR